MRVRTVGTFGLIAAAGAQPETNTPGMRAMKHVLHMTGVPSAMIAIDDPELAPAMHVRHDGTAEGYITLTGDTWDIVSQRVIRHLQIPMKAKLGNRKQRRAEEARARGKTRGPSFHPVSDNMREAANRFPKRFK